MCLPEVLSSENFNEGGMPSCECGDWPHSYERWSDVMNFEPNDIEAEVIEAERVHEEVANGFVHCQDGRMVVARDLDAARYLKNLMRVVEGIQASADDVSILVKSARGQPSIRFNKLGLDLFIACRLYRTKICSVDSDGVKPLYEGRRLHPVLAAGLPVVAEFEQRVQLAALEDHERLHGHLATMVDAIRERCRVGQVKRKTEYFRRNSRAKLDRALKYVLSLYGKKSRLLILRVDLYIRPGSRDWGYSEEADAAFDTFLDDLASGRILPNVVGWMSAREDGIERGRHCHALVAIDGHKHHAGVNLAKLLGEYWVNECVGCGETASYFNCFSLVRSYRHLGIGMVRCDDRDRLLGLHHAVRYLCKDAVMLVPTSGRPRNFRRGEVDRDYIRFGAPRSNDDGLMLARKVLLDTKRRRSKVSVSYRSKAYRYSCPT